MKILYILVALVVLANAIPSKPTGDQEKDHHHKINRQSRKQPKLPAAEDAAYWKQLGQQLLQDELNKRALNTAAKNIIFFLGDGMSISTVTAARIYKGQKAGNPGEETQMVWDRFPYGALSRTYCVDAQVADSACSATAYLGGVKTNIDTIGVDANVLFGDCDAMNVPEYRVDSIMKWAQDANKGTGIVTTTRITHATPAGTYAHTANRDWEDDAYIYFDGLDTDLCSDIAEQLVETAPGNQFKVILGGGRLNFLPNTVNDPEALRAGRRRDGKNLIEDWKSYQPNGVYVSSRDELLAVDVQQTDSLLGLFSPNHMEYFIESANANNPTLEEMTRTAISMLQKEANGYVLLVEGGRIDLAHHDGRAKVSLEETLQFDLAIEAALNMTNREDTLIIVTADHSHTMTISGYPDRGNPLLGFADISSIDNKPYTTLSYANGPGYRVPVGGSRPDLTGVDTTADNFLQPAMVPLGSETHGGDDVGIYAIGPQAHLFQGVYEENYIAHVMAYAACIGPGLKFCDGK